MSRFHRFISFSALLVTLAVPVIVLANWQHVYNWWRLRDYQPPARVSELAAVTTMTDEAKRLFYINHPTLLSDKAVFRQKCSIAEQTIILGCYVTGSGIYIYDVTDERLNGIEEVTAAHELLHVVYDRLPREERTIIDRELTKVFDSLADERIKTVVGQYRQRDPSIVSNELHSILGTEVRQLTPKLEEHYARYFKNRLDVVTFSEQYEQEFIERRAKIAAYDQQLADLKAQIEALENDLQHRGQEIDAERRRLDQLLANNQVEAYNAGVPNFNSMVRAYNNEVARLRKLIEQHNAIVAARNQIALEEQALVEAVDTRINVRPEE